MVIELGKCCLPVPGDRIIGFVNEKKVVVVHRVKCKSIPELLTENTFNIKVEWSELNEKVFPVKIQIIGRDRKHILKDMANEISTMDINITGMHIEIEGIVAITDVTIEVESLIKLNNVMDNISKVKGVQKVKRV